MKFKKFFKKCLKWACEEFTYWTSQRVLDAINDGCSGDEVAAVVKQEAGLEFGRLYRKVREV